MEEEQLASPCWPSFFPLIELWSKVPLTSNFAIMFLALAHVLGKRSLPLQIVEHNEGVAKGHL
jgi:hypothetical protein